MTKRIIAGLMCLVLLFTAVPVAAFAANEEQATVDTGDVSIEGTNGFGTLLSQEISESQAEADAQAEDYEAGYTVTDLVIEGATATVTYDSMEEAVLVVALYTEDGMQMVTSATATVTADATEAVVEFTGEMPEYFLASAYLMDIYDLSPLCAAYDTPMYTQEMQELLASTVEDYDADRVLNLDDDNTTNFAVYADTTKVIEAIEGVNQVASIDDENATYVIKNADEQITSLTAGDVFVYPYAENEILIVKVAEITVSGTTVTITGDEMEMEEVFSHMKIESGSDTSDFTVDDSTAAEGITYVGLVEEGNQPLVWEGSGSATAAHDFKIELEKEYEEDGVAAACTVTGKLEVALAVTFNYYISLSEQFIEFKADPSVVMSLSIEGTISGSYPIGEFSVSPVAGVYVGFEPKLKAEYSGTVAVTAEFSMTIGIAFGSDTGFNNLTTTPKFKINLGMEGTIFLGFDFAPNAKIIHKKVASMELSAVVGFEVTAKLSGRSVEFETGAQSRHSCWSCLAIDTVAKAEVTGELKFLNLDWLTVNVDVAKLSFELGSMYLSSEESGLRYGTCSNYTYRITVQVLDQDGAAVSDASVTAGSETISTNKRGIAVFYLPKDTYKLTASSQDLTGSQEIKIDEAKKVTITLRDPNEDTVVSWFAGVLGTWISEKIISRGHGSVTREGSCGADLQWELYEDGYLRIWGTGDMSASAFRDIQNEITAVYIEPGCTSLGSRAFYNASNLKSVKMPDTITKIGDYALYGTALTKLVIPGSVTGMGWNCFSNNSLLETVVMESGCTLINEKAFRGCANLSSLTVPATLTTISPTSFSGCSKLTTAGPIGSGCNYEFGWTGMIPNYAFNDLDSLTAVTIPDGIAQIGDSAFYDCDALPAIQLPESLVSIRPKAFESCNSLADIHIPDGVVEIGSSALRETALKEITIPGSVLRMGSSAFAMNAQLETVVMESGCAEIGTYAFSACGSLSNLTVPDTVTMIGSNAFRSCGKLVTAGPIGSGCNYEFGWTETIPDYAFYDLDSLTAVTIPAGIAQIGDYAFYSCEALPAVQLPDRLASVGNNAFGDCVNLSNINIPNGIEKISVGALSNTALTEVAIPCDMDAYAFSGNTKLETVVIGARCSRIDIHAFINCNNLQSVTFRGDAPDINLGAFSGVTANAYYPAGNSTWNEDTLDDYGGTITWFPYTAGAGYSVIPDEAYAAAAVENDAVPLIPTAVPVRIPGQNGGEVISPDAVYGGEYETDVTQTCVLKTASFTGLVPGEQYVLLAMKSIEVTDPLASDNLLFIDQGVALEDGTLSFQYVQRETADISYVVACGASNKDLNDAQITFPEMTADGELQVVAPTVVYDGVTLTEGRDYVIVGTVDFTEAGEYTCYIRGIHNYTGLVECAYTVAKAAVTEIASGWSGATQWTLTDDGIITFSGSGNMKNYGYGGGQPWAEYADRITTVIIEDGVTAVGSGAFMNLSKLESVTLPTSGLNKIGEAAFYGCSALKEIYIPDGVYTIWAYTFKNCPALTDLRLPATLVKVDQGAFEACTGLTELFIPGQTEIIGAWSFKGCSGLTAVDMQWADATQIRAGAFKNCTALTDVILPAGIQVLGDSAFYGIGAASFTIPATVTEVGPWCFARAALDEVTFAGDAPAIGEGAFNKITLTAFYPGDNATWTADTMQNYGGTVTWKAQ